MRGGPNLPDGVVDYLDLELSYRFPFSIASVLWTVVVATLSKVISGRVFLVVETADLTNKVPSSLAISVVSSAAVVVAAFLRSLVLQPHLHHVGAASSACVRPVRNNGDLVLGSAPLLAATVSS